MPPLNPSGGGGVGSGGEGDSGVATTLLWGIGLALHDAANACSCGRGDALMAIGGPLDVDNMWATWLRVPQA